MPTAGWGVETRAHFLADAGVSGDQIPWLRGVGGEEGVQREEWGGNIVEGAGAEVLNGDADDWGRVGFDEVGEGGGEDGELGGLDRTVGFDEREDFGELGPVVPEVGVHPDVGGGGGVVEGLEHGFSYDAEVVT